MSKICEKLPFQKCNSIDNDSNNNNNNEDPYACNNIVNDAKCFRFFSRHKPVALKRFLQDPERLVIGKFCQIADGVVFITSSANHRHDGISSFPFAIFDGGPTGGRPSMPAPGADTVIGHDVWLGQGARILPGARIGVCPNRDLLRKRDPIGCCLGCLRSLSWCSLTYSL